MGYGNYDPIQLCTAKLKTKFHRTRILPVSDRFPFNSCLILLRKVKLSLSLTKNHVMKMRLLLS
jgi:hypothetical protein